MYGAQDEPRELDVTVGPDDSFQLQAHVTSPAYTFAYRWSVYSSGDPVMRWPVATLGFGDAGEGFSLSNNDLTVTAAGQGLPLGEYLVKLEARYPASGCTYPWFLGSPGAFSLRVGHTLDGVAPGQVVEGAPFRVYSRTWTEGETGYVFIDEDTANPPGELIYSDIVQPGGFIQITPNPGDLPAIGASWYVSVGVEEDGSGRSTWVNALEVRPAGSIVSPLLVPAEPVGGNETVHPIIPGETWLGAWDEPGDTDYFWFSAGAGTQVSITLDRSDLTDPPQHPDTPSPELFLGRPDGVVLRASEPLGLDDTGTSIAATLTMDGAHTIAVRSSKGSGDYLLRMDITAEAGSGVFEFGFTRSRTHLMTDGGLTPSPYTTMLDPFGNPITGTWVSWEQGVECGMGDFCGNGTVIRVRSSVDGHAVLVGQDPPDAGSDPMWRPGATLGQMLKNRPIERPGVAERLAHARSVQPILGVINVSGRQVISADLPDLGAAKEMTAKAQIGARAREEALLKGGDNCAPQSATCPDDAAPVFRVAKLDLPAGHELVDLEVRIVETDQVGRPLDGTEVLLDIPLRLEVDAHMLDDIGQPYTDTSLIDQPVSLVLSEDGGGALSDGVTTCSHLATPPGDFTYWNSSRAALHYSYDEPDGSPCCYLPTELIQASVTVYFEVDDGFGTMVPVSMEAAKIAQSTPRPADPCEIRPWPPGAYPGGVAQIAGPGPHLLPPTETDTWQWIGSVYTTDACGNINHLAATDPQLSVTNLTPFDPEVWAELVHDDHDWLWGIYLHSTHCLDPPCTAPEDDFFIPDGAYTVDLGIGQSAACGGGTATYDQTVDYAAHRPVIQLKWVQSGEEPLSPMVSPGSAIRHPSTGELIAWKVRPGEFYPTQFVGPIRYTDIPVKLYVARNRVEFDDDGNVASYYEKVDDAEICVGEVHWHTDPAAYPDPGWDVTTTTCDQVFTGETTVMAYTEPEYTGGFFDGPVGVAAGVSKAPDQAGSYFLVAEPLDEAFRRGDSWRIDQDMVLTGYDMYSGTYRKEFEVGGGVFLDEDWRPITDPIVNLNERTIFLKASLDVPGDIATVTLSFLDEEGTSEEHTMQVVRKGSAMDGTGVFLGQIDLVQATDPGVTKARAVQKSGDDLPVIEVETRRGFSGKIVAWVQAIFGDEEQEISVALLESYWLEFEDIKGLYKPDGSYEKGYSSDDGLGRVYNHWKFQPDDPSQGEFRRFERSVSIEVRVHPEDKPIPDGVLVKWEALDPDDDSDEDPSVVLFAGCRIDPGDYDSDCTERADPIGGRGGDNLGFRGYSPWWERERLPDGTPDPTYEFAEFEISMPPPIPSTWFATTSVHENTSKVKFNLTDAGGDNFQVEASLVPADDVFDSRSPAATGVFTLWKRIFVEYRRMGDLSVPWSEEGLRGLLNDRYKLAFVEYKIPEPLGQATDYPFLRPKPQYPGFYEYVGLWDGVGLGQFHHRQDELWHFLGHARLLDETSDGEVILPVDTPGIQAVEFLSPTELRLLTGDTFSTGSLKGLALVLSTTDGHRITFTIALNDADMITIEPFSYGVIDTAPFFSIDLVAPSWLAFRNDFFVIAEGGGRTIGATETGGVAFLVFNEAIDIMAAKPEAPPWAEICQETIVHELVHTYDTRDNCGRTATDGSKCMMTYDFVPALTLDQNGSVEGLDWDLSGGSSICPEHILAIRKSDREGSY